MKYRGLFYKDIMNLRSSLIVMAVLLVIFCLIFIPSGGFYSLFVAIAIFAPILVVLSITMDNEEKWNSFVLTTSVSRKNVVRSKYYLMILLTILSWIVAILMCVILKTLGFGNEGLTLLTFAISATVGILHGSLMLPLRFKIDSNAIHYISVASVILLASIIGSVYFFMMDAIGTALYLPAVGMVLGVLVVSIVLFGVSYLISQKVYAKKEF